MHVVEVDHPNGPWDAIYCKTEGQARAIEQLQTLRHEIATKYHDYSMAVWKGVVSTDVYQDLKHGAYRDIMNLLSDGEISVGKAAQSIAERAAGIEPALPAPTAENNKSWKEMYDELKAEHEREMEKWQETWDGRKSL